MPGTGFLTQHKQGGNEGRERAWERGKERREIEMCKVRQRQMKTKKPMSVDGTATEMPKLLASLTDDITAPYRKSITFWPLGNISVADKLWAATYVLSSSSSLALTWTPILYCRSFSSRDKEIKRNGGERGGVTALLLLSFAWVNYKNHKC